MTANRPLLFPLAAAAVVAATAGPSRPARGADDCQPVTLTTGDGAKLSARYFPGNKGAKSPAVVVLDDVGDAARPAACDDLARLLAKQGCTVLCFDFRGCGQSKGVEPEFWDSPTNQHLVKGYRADAPPDEIRFADFKPGYLPTLANDVAAARAHLERRNDAGECNTGQLFAIGYGRGATIGQLWVASEWARYRVTGIQNKVATKPEGRDIAGCVWAGPKLALDKQPVPMFDLLKQSLVKKSLLVGLIHDADDAEGARFAKQCQDAFNVADKTRSVSAHSAGHETLPLGSRPAVAEKIGTLVADMRKARDLPVWENRNFGDRRYVWAFKGAAAVPAKDEGDDFFQPVPTAQLLGKR